MRSGRILGRSIGRSVGRTTPSFSQTSLQSYLTDPRSQPRPSQLQNTMFPDSLGGGFRDDTKPFTNELRQLETSLEQRQREEWNDYRKYRLTNPELIPGIMKRLKAKLDTWFEYLLRVWDKVKKQLAEMGNNTKDFYFWMDSRMEYQYISWKDTEQRCRDYFKEGKEELKAYDAIVKRFGDIPRENKEDLETSSRASKVTFQDRPKAHSLHPMFKTYTNN